MSLRTKMRTSSDNCADCGAPDATWASVNRSVFMCDECCSIHRSLGRHISQVKSLRKGQWNPTQLNMVHQLVSAGANSIWEYSLVDPTQTKHQRKKPAAKDPLHPNKADFIRAKYQFLAFLNKSKDAENSTIEDLSQQLHSSVRTANLETSLRLLSLGADPNYFHTEKGNCALHVAAQSGQALQVELLVVYGADPGAFDANGKTPVEHARQEGQADLAERISECQYELTDMLAFYLCGRKPDHRAGQHFIIPEMADSSIDMSELAKAAKKKLQALPNRLFEELAMDVYDEVDRRTNDQIWHQSQPNSNAAVPIVDRQPVSFLPVNPEFSSTRNQGRQKLARFNAREFATLIIDILSDAKRRQQGVSVISTAPLPEKHAEKQHPLVVKRVASHNSLSDDEPLYDSVASDEDYASIGDNQSIKKDFSKSIEDDHIYKRIVHNRDSSPLSIISFVESVTSSEQSDGPITLEEYLQVKRELVESRSKVQQLQQINKDLRQQINILQTEVQRLVHENHRMQFSGHKEVKDLSNGPSGDHSVRRPMSMIEARDQRQQAAHRSKHTSPVATTTQQVPVRPERPKKPAALLPPCRESVNAESDYDNDDNTESSQLGDHSSGSTRSSGRSDSSQGTDISRTPTSDVHMMYPDDPTMPAQEVIVKKTEKITKKIQELLRNVQDGKQETYVGCAEKISTAINDMAALFPQNLKNEKVKSALHLLVSVAAKLKDECKGTSSDSEEDPKLRTQQVIQCAYEIAKAEKQLVVLFQ